MNYVMLIDCNEPSCYKESVQMKDSAKWQLAMQSEMTALEKNQTWKLVEEEKAERKKIPYASAVGSLMYAMIATRPDIAFAMVVVSQYMSNPGKKHWEAVKGILRYLKATKNMCICYGSQELSVMGYTDSDYAGDLDNRRSTSGVRGNLAWSAGDKLGIKEETPMLHCDSQSAIQLACNTVYHSKTKHVDVKYHFIREMVEDKQVQLVKVHTTDNLADLLTKGLPGESFAHCCKLLGVG
ncbi:hypothetical protein L7F22_009786 [Adiantum nelumboides]|nr:hypothetical protein [Adiantum nelumboides]